MPINCGVNEDCRFTVVDVASSSGHFFFLVSWCVAVPVTQFTNNWPKVFKTARG